MNAGESVTVSACFDDPGGGVLSYEVVISDPGVATVTTSGANVTVTAVSPGHARVTVFADNRHGQRAQQTFLVVVPDRPPVAVAAIADIDLRVGDSATLDVSGYFTEPDGQSLAYAAASDTTVVRLSMAGTALTVLAVGKGTAMVAVTAADPAGLTATQSFSVNVPNRAPVAKGGMSAQTVEVGDTAAVDFSAFFTDPDGDALTFSAAVSDRTVAEVLVEGDTVAVAAIAKGEVTVTVTATDTEGLTAMQGFSVTVPNRAPMPSDSIPPQIVVLGSPTTVEMAPFFADPDGDALTFVAAVADSAVAEASVAERSVVLTAVAKGETTVTVTAADAEGLTAVQMFAVTVPNHPPATVASIPAQTVQVDATITLDMSAYFNDPDGDPLSHAAVSTDSAVAMAAAAAAVVTVTGVARGETIVTVTATDPAGLVATQSFPVTVPNQSPVVAKRILAQRVEEGSVTTLDLASHFNDPDGDPLSFQAMSSDIVVAAATSEGAVLTLSGKEIGNATITVTASDREGLSAAQDFGVAVVRPRAQNRRPIAFARIRSQTLSAGGSLSVDLDEHFSDPEGDSLWFEASSSDETVATAGIDGRSLVVEAVGVGTARVTVRATDPSGEYSTIRFRVTVGGDGTGGAQPGEAPIVIARLPHRTLTPEGSFSADLGDHFRDPDNEPLHYDVTSADETVATAGISGSEMTVTGVGVGSTRVGVTASDPGNRTATLSFAVTVETAGGGNRRPVAARVIAFQELDPDETFEADLDSYFSDPDNDRLSYGASSSDGGVATADVAGSNLTVVAVANGTTTISVAAEDPQGLTASLDFDVTVRPPPPPNRAPRVTKAFPDRIFARNKSLPVQGWRHFDDPDDDPLTFSGTSSNSSVATIDQQSDIYFEVETRSDGEATITVTARDPHGLTAAGSFQLTVGNNAPRVTDRAPALTSSPGQVDTLVMRSHFEDPDGGDELSFSASSSNTAAVSAGIRFDPIYGDIAEVRGKAVGQATVTLTATDLGGLSASQSFVVTVESNRPPGVTNSLPSRIALAVGDTVSYVLSGYFEDPDGDPLTYTAAAGFAASAHVSGGTLHIVGVQPGISPARVTAEDPGGKTASQTFLVRVQARSALTRSSEPPRLLQISRSNRAMPVHGRALSTAAPPSRRIPSP